jgi:DNA-binding transcriptional LysR family regulator
MNLDQIITFLTVYQMGNYQKAADHLYLPQPTISHRITQLERDLGKALLIRGKGNVKLTEEGKAFLPHARRILGALQEGKDAVEKVMLGETGKLSIGCTNVFAAHVLPELLDSFLEIYPQISIKVYSYAPTELLRLMKNQYFQIGITNFTSNDSQIIYRPVFSEQTRLFVSPQHPFASCDSVSLEEILKEPLIVYPKETSSRKMIDATLSQFNLTYHTKVETNNLQLIIHFIKKNTGVFLSGSLTLRQEIESKQLVQVEIKNNPFPLSHIFLAYPDVDLNSLEHLFIKHFEEQINKQAENAY